MLLAANPLFIGTIPAVNGMELLRTFTIVLGLNLFLTQSHGCWLLTVCNPIEVHSAPVYNPRYKYGKARVQYYANCTATYQMLLESGDIHPNPGPMTPGNNHQHSEHTTHPKGRICYDVANLQKLKPHPHNIQYQRLPSEVWRNIVDLGIAKRRKTRRGKRPKAQNTDLPSTLEESFTDQQHLNTGGTICLKEKGLKIAHLNVCSLTAKFYQ